MDERPIVIDIKDVKKKYIIRHNREKATSFSGKLKNAGNYIFHPSNRKEKEDFWALNGVTFQVRQGEKVGIIGKNGAGKSTLLKILSRITEPTDGRIELLGKVSAMLEVGTGFNGELTGRENVYLNGAILGMTKEEIDEKYDDIVQFSEVGKFIDTPVKRYSSGMFVRLAFAVASHLEPDILIVDEVLAVGDTKFQRKCITRMMNIAEGGKTILYVSHQMHTIRQLCDRVIVLKAGQVVFDGDVEKGIAMYTETADVSQSTNIDLSDHKPRGTQMAVVENVKILEKERCEWLYNESIKIKVRLKITEDCDNPSIMFVIRNLSYQTLASARTPDLGQLKAGQEIDYVLTVNTKDILAPDKYVAGIEVWKITDTLKTVHDVVPEMFSFEILDGDKESNDAKETQWDPSINGNTMLPEIETELSKD